MDIIQEAKNLALKEIEKYGIPTPNEQKLLIKKASELAGKLNAEKTVILVGVWLMDVKLGEAWAKNKVPEHVKMGVETTKKFLEKFDLDEETKNKIINCVEAHHGQVPYICKEAEICANVDCYRFLHPRGLFEKFAITNKPSLSYDECLDLINSKLDEKYKMLSLDICRKELEGYYHQFKELIKAARESKDC